MRRQLVKTLTEIAEKDDRLVILLPDFAEYQFREFKAKYPDRIYNTGIRECATVGMAAGLALEGMIPIVYTIAPFLIDRAWEFIKLDLCAQKLGAVLVGCNIDRFYGESHQCDFSYTRMTMLDVDWWSCGNTLILDHWLRTKYANGRVNYFEVK